MSWPTEHPADTFAPIEQRENHLLEVYLSASGEVQDARMDGESFWPDWFKIEWKGASGELSAKVRGVKLSTRLGDQITFHQSSGSSTS